jgi:hypothetical protein
MQKTNKYQVDNKPPERRSKLKVHTKNQKKISTRSQDVA